MRVTLREVEPAVVRLIDVPASTTLPELHDLLQAALGWTDRHLHEFIAGDDVWGTADPDADWQRDERDARLKNLPDRFTYHYDFGDGWEHDVEILGAGAERPGCVGGEGRCPPEDCGGPHRYAELLAVLADPSHPDHDEMREWAGELADFDLAATDRLVRDVVGTVPDSVRLVLGLAEGGVHLTPGGRLKRSFVRQVQEQRPHWYPLDRPASIEEDLFPLTALHDVLRKVGLLRLSKGVLRPTRAAGDDREIVRRLRSWFPRDDFIGILANRIVAVLAATGAQPVDELTSRVYPMLGYGWVADGQPLAEDGARAVINEMHPELASLDMVETHGQMWHPGGSARSLLPGVPLLARLLPIT